MECKASRYIHWSRSFGYLLLKNMLQLIFMLIQRKGPRNKYIICGKRYEIPYVKLQYDNTDNIGMITDEDLWKDGDIGSKKLDPKARNIV